MTEIYRVEKIYEDDFGCEERAEGHEPQVIVILRDPAGNEISVKQADAWMYQQEVDEGSRALLIGGKLYRAE